MRTFLLRGTHKCRASCTSCGLHIFHRWQREEEDRGAQGLLERVVENCDGGEGRSERARHVVQPISKTVACHISSHRTGI